MFQKLQKIDGAIPDVAVVNTPWGTLLFTMDGVGLAVSTFDRAAAPAKVKELRKCWKEFLNDPTVPQQRHWSLQGTAKMFHKWLMDWPAKNRKSAKKPVKATKKRSYPMTQVFRPL